MKRSVWVIVALILLGVGTAAYFQLNHKAEPLPVAQHVIVPQPPAPPPPTPPPLPAPLQTPFEPAIVHPLVSVPTATPLPALERSDAAIVNALLGVLGKQWKAILLPEALIHNIVATVDNLPRPYLPAKIVPLARVPGAFITSGDSQELAIGAPNGERYAAHIQLIETVDGARLVAVYRQFYPLFQRAYVELGYPTGYFNDRLIEAIDDLLAAPTPDQPIRLVQPKVLYRLADAQLESRSAGQRIMIRMGSENAARLKEKLREIRQQVALSGGASRP